MKGMSHFSISAVLLLTILIFAFPAQAYFEFDQQGDNHTYDLGYYFAVTGGKFPGDDLPNGDDASGGTFRRLSDDVTWGFPIDQWYKDSWFAQNAGLALTLKNGNAIVYDNNGIEDEKDESEVSYYDYSGAACDGKWPGAIQGYCMANNWDLIYATYFRLPQETVFDTIIGYFVPTPSDVAHFVPSSPFVSYRMNIWSSIQDNPDRPKSYIPAVTSFTGDVFTTHLIRGGVFEVSATGLNIVYPDDCSGIPYAPTGADPIWRLVLKLREPMTLPAGVYFFSHDAIVVTSVMIDIKPGSDLNIIDPQSRGVVPVAILTTSHFKASRVDTSSVVLAGASVVSWTMKDVDQDGDIDKLLYFKVRDLMLDENTTEAVLTGFTKEGIPIKGTDKVQIAPRMRIGF